MIGDPRVEFDVLLVMAALACVTFIITTIILWIYSRPGLNILVLVTVFIGWFCSFSLSWLIPIDMLPSENLHKVRIAWEILYWVSFCLTWFLSPTLRLYHASGYLTRWSRFKDALLVNLYYNGIIAIVGIVLFVLILALKKQQFVSSLMSVAVALSTAWGLTLLVLLLGYGIVEVPRRLWNVKNKSRSLAMLYRDIVETDNERDEAMDRLADAYKATNIYHRRLEVENFSLDEIQALREFISLFKQKFPTLIQGYRPVEEISTFSAKADTAKISIHLLASMHAEIKRDLHEVRRASARFEAIYERIVSMTKDGPENAVDDTLNNGGLCDNLIKAICKTIAIIAGCFSVIVLYSEISLNFYQYVTKDVSPISILLDYTRPNPIATQVIGTIILGYFSVCGYFSLFQVRLFSSYHMHSKRMTEETSLLVNCEYIIRISFSLGLNFLNIAYPTLSGYDPDSIPQTAFQQKFKQVDIVPVFGKQFNLYVPLLISLFSILTLFNVFGKVLQFFRLVRSKYDPSSVTEFDISEGKAIVKKETIRRASSRIRTTEV